MIDYEKKRVLVIDDHPGMRTSIRTTLSHFGVVKTDMAMTAFEATRRIKQIPYDIIVCDYNLGEGRDGQQFLEELRHTKLIPLSTIFLMVTAERVYERVMSAAELAPDDYLIKPFTADTLHQRLNRLIEKKEAFLPTYTAMDAGNIDRAIANCDRLVAEKPIYTVDALRLKAELLIALGKITEAQALYEQVVAMRAVPWARMGLAKTLFMQDRMEDAEAELEDLCDESPDFMAANDLLAQVQQSQGKLTDAQATLARAVANSPNTISRQKLFGELALANGDLEKAEQAFGTVLAKGTHSILRNPEDHARMARVQVERGKLKEADATIGELRQHYPNDPAAECVASVLESLKETKAGNPTAAKQAIERALKIRAESAIGLSDNLSLDLAHGCLANGLEDTGRKLVSELVNNNHDNAPLLDKTRQLFTSLGRAEEGEQIVQECIKNAVSMNNEAVKLARSGDLPGSVNLLIQAVENMPNNVQILLNAAQAIMTLLRQAGWSDDRAALADVYIQQAKQRNPDHPKLAKVNALYRDVAQKYGVTL